MTAKLTEWLAGLGVLLGILGGIYFYGHHEGYAESQAAFAKLQKQADDSWQKKLDAANANGDKLAADLEVAKKNVRVVEKTVRVEIPKVTTVYKEKPGAPAQPIPAAVITWGFVRLWNDASDPSVKHAVPASAVGAATTPEESDLVKSGVTVSGILANHVANAKRYAECRLQLNRLIDFEEQNPTAAPAAAASSPQ